MRIIYLDCFAGISGDMFLGALLDAGLDPKVLHEAAASLKVGASLKIEKVDRSGITATKVHVLEGERLAEASGVSGHSHAESHAHSHSSASLAHAEVRGESRSSHADADSFREQRTRQGEPLQQEPNTQHLHKGGHAHEHTHAPSDSAGTATVEAHAHSEQHEHSHGRSLTVIRELIRSSGLEGPVKEFAIRTFELLGAAEAKIHNVPVDAIHFHEVGGVDAIVDIVAASAGIHALNAQAVAETGEPMLWYSSALNVGGGMVDCAHGRFPVPAPATADLLRGLPTYSADIEKELVTPTGAALIRALGPSFGRQPAMRVATIGYGAGTRNPANFPNVLRVSIGDALEESAGAGSGSTSHERLKSEQRGSAAGTVMVIETAIDDLSPQILAHVTETALQLGAFDVMCTAVGMKKGRMGTLITILCDEAHSAKLESLLLRETSTLGVRVREERRSCLERSHVAVQTAFGAIRMKIGSLEGRELNAAPEFEDCRAAAFSSKAPVKLVMQAAVAAYAAVKAAE
jgi:uncharacterized protein (TIGR00299 family) protein